MTNMTASGSVEDAQKLLHGQLCGLAAVGEHGFEGFMARALSELTGQAFHVAKSGHQSGSDVRSAPQNLFKLGLESKHYGDSTSLQRDALLHKITDASNAHVPVDLWLLAATRRVDVSDREKLQEYGESIGIGVVVLDYPDNLTQLCDLMVICGDGRPQPSNKKGQGFSQEEVISYADRLFDDGALEVTERYLHRRSAI